MAESNEDSVASQRSMRVQYARDTVPQYVRKIYNGDVFPLPNTTREEIEGAFSTAVFFGYIEVDWSQRNIPVVVTDPDDAIWKQDWRGFVSTLRQAARDVKAAREDAKTLAGKQARKQARNNAYESGRYPINKTIGKKGKEKCVYA